MVCVNCVSVVLYAQTLQETVGYIRSVFAIFFYAVSAKPSESTSPVHPDITKGEGECFYNMLLSSDFLLKGKDKFRLN